MAIYEYTCSACGPFEADRPMAEYRQPLACPECGVEAPRVMRTAPWLAGMPAELRQAHVVNERSAHEPKQGHRHGPSCGCGSTNKRKGAAARTPAGAKSFPSKRPWMISH